MMAREGYFVTAAAAGHLGQGHSGGAPRVRSRWLAAVVVPLALACASGNALLASETNGPTPLPDVQVTYLERCGGCHGIQGHSAPREVPRLRGQVGSFLCLPEGRAYLVRLPSVARSPLPDDELAALMNFVVFDLGAVPADRTRFPPYTAAEVGVLRQQPLNGAGLAGYRAALVERMIDRCAAPPTLREYVSAQGDP